MAALHHVVDGRAHVVTQVVEAELVVGRIGDVAAVGGALFLGRLERVDDTGRHPELGVDLAHPVRVALGEIVVDRDDVHALARQRVEVGRKGRDERLALARPHLGDVAAVQEDPANELHVEGAQPERPPRCLAAVCKRFGQDVVEAFAGRHPFLQLGSLRLDSLVAQRLELRLQRIDLLDERADRFDLAVVRRAEDLLRDSSDAQHVFSARVRLTCL